MFSFHTTAMYIRFCWGLRNFLRERISVGQAEEILKQRLRQREHNFLEVIKRAVYGNVNSPYLKLLHLAGCEYGDIEKMTACDGIDSALEKLRRAGVYLSLEEFKGIQDVIRHGKTFRFEEREFDNPLMVSRLEASSGATRSVGTRTVYDFDSLNAYWTVHMVPVFDALGVFGLPHALWHSINPGVGPLLLLTFTQAGYPPVKWFSTLHKGSSIRSLKNKMATNYIVYGGRCFGAKWPVPEYIDFNDAWKVAKWAADAIHDHGGCCLKTHTSSAVRVCRAARERGLDISGATFVVSGEPVTKMKRREIEATGAIAYPYYGFMEAGVVAVGCLERHEIDDVHLFEDSLAAISHQRQVHHAGVSVDAFLFTSLLLSASKILLNVEIGDYGVMETRRCGCPFERLGFTKHLYDIRGFDKLTSAGMNVTGTELVRIIEEVLPAKFGGTSIDYQLVEEEDEQGYTRVSIIVSPSVGRIDEVALVDTFLAEMRRRKISDKEAADTWFRAGTLGVKRLNPLPTVRGKLLPLHIERSSKLNGTIR